MYSPKVFSVTALLLLSTQLRAVVKGQAANITTPTTARIHDIQGSESFPLLFNQTVRVEGAIVIGDFQNGDADTGRNLGGFWIQEQDINVDGNASTSEGIFVADGDLTDAFVDVNVGDQVIVSGIVEEKFDQTQISALSVEIIDSNNELPTPTVIELPLSPDTSLEAYEGMYVTFPQELMITEMYNLDRFSEIRLYAGAERPFQFTQVNEPDAEAFQEHLAELQSLSIAYEDGRDGSTNDVVPFDGFEPYTTATAPRMGDTITDLTGVLTYAFGSFRVRSVMDGSVTVTSANPRPVEPPTVGGNLKMTIFNVLNFFITLDEGEDPGTGPSNGEPRGADSALEYERQLEKLTLALVELDADIVGLAELENNFPAVLETLVSAVNARIGSEVYAYVDPGRQFVDNSDVISVGFMYKPEVVQVVGTPAILDDSILPALGMLDGTVLFDGQDTNRASMAITFLMTGSSDGCITVANNHWKSKGGSGTGDDADQGDGQGNWNARRTMAAEAVLEWLNIDPTGYECPYHAIMGDLNAYAQEDPITTLLAAGYSNVEANDAYSYVFDGQIGTLDYILVNEALSENLAGAAIWHINEDEADAIDYNLDFGRPETFFDASVPFRSSDHSPVLVGLEMSTDDDSAAATDSAPTTEAPTITPVSEETNGDEDEMDETGDETATSVPEATNGGEDAVDSSSGEERSYYTAAATLFFFGLINGLG